MFLNGASYDHPEDWSPATQAIVELVFGGRLNTPLCGDAEAFHPAGGIWTGKNALFFGGRVEKNQGEVITSAAEPHLLKRNGRSVLQLPENFRAAAQQVVPVVAIYKGGSRSVDRLSLGSSCPLPEETGSASWSRLNGPPFAGAGPVNVLVHVSHERRAPRSWGRWEKASAHPITLM